MSQHDYVIANGTGAAVRSDLNNALAAIVSQNSGATEPATMYSYQWWADTTTGLLKLRNAANNAWVTLFQLDGEWSTLAVENGSAAAPSIYFKDSGTDTGIYSPGADQVAISTGGTERARIDSSGRLLVGTSTANTSGAKLQTVDGITFPATQVASADPNTLDDYEEGTWTPTIIGTTTAGTATYALRNARYTKVGRVVQIEVLISWSSGNGTGNLRMGGLPFTSGGANTTPGLAIGYCSGIALTASHVLMAQVADGSTQIRFTSYPSGGGSIVEVAYDGDGPGIAVGGTYSV